MIKNEIVRIFLLCVGLIAFVVACAKLDATKPEDLEGVEWNSTLSLPSSSSSDLVRSSSAVSSSTEVVISSSAVSSSSDAPISSSDAPVSSSDLPISSSDIVVSSSAVTSSSSDVVVSSSAVTSSSSDIVVSSSAVTSSSSDTPVSSSETTSSSSEAVFVYIPPFRDSTGLGGRVGSYVFGTNAGSSTSIDCQMTGGAVYVDQAPSNILECHDSSDGFKMIISLEIGAFGGLGLSFGLGPSSDSTLAGVTPPDLSSRDSICIEYLAKDSLNLKLVNINHTNDGADYIYTLPSTGLTYSNICIHLADFEFQIGLESLEYPLDLTNLVAVGAEANTNRTNSEFFVKWIEFR